MSALSGVATPAAATFHDLRRRPSLMLATLAVATFLWLLPDICARAVDDSAALALQAGLATITIFLMLVAGAAGLRAGAAEGDLGAAGEWRVSPISPAAYVAGRFCGILAVAAPLLAGLSAVVLARQFAAIAEAPPTLAAAASALVGATLSAAQLGAVGLLFATLTSPQFAAILFVATLVATRTIVPDLASRDGVLAHLAALLPDPARLDFTRELAFQRPLDPTAVLVACTSSVLATAACLCLAAGALARRES